MKKLLVLAAVLCGGLAYGQTSTQETLQSVPNANQGVIVPADDAFYEMVKRANEQQAPQVVPQGGNVQSQPSIAPRVGHAAPVPAPFTSEPSNAVGHKRQNQNGHGHPHPPGGNLPLDANGKLLSVDGLSVDFRHPKDSAISSVCWTPNPFVNGTAKDAACSYVVPCDNPANRDAVNTSTIDYFQLEWHVMWDGGAPSNITQATINALMAELNADYAASNMIFCANPANFYEDAVNYTHDENTEEFSLKATYNTNPTQLINIYVVGTMGPGGYARFPYDPNGGTNANGGIVLNRGNCSVGTHTLAHEMGHTFGLAHTFAGVDERADCSSCYEKVRNVNGSSNTTGVPTPLGGPYTDEGDREGDWCSDTNPHDTHTYQCNTSSNPNNACDSHPWANAPVNNHMSYSFCSSTFSAQQTRRMHCMVDSYLGSWVGYGGGICGAQPPAADFVGTPTTWQAPSVVNFTDLTQPTAIVTNWTWTFDVGASGTVTCAGCTGANATFVGQTPPPVTYPNAGLYTVSLTVASANGPDTETKVDYILVNAPAGDCDTLTTQWETPTPTVITYGFGGGWITGVPDPVNLVLPTDAKGIYEAYFTPNPGTTPIGALRVGLGSLMDVNDDMTFQVVVYDDDGAGAPGAVLGGVGGISPTQLGVPGAGFFGEFWIPFFNAPVPTTGLFHVGVEIFAGGAADTLVVMTSCLGPPGCPIAQGEADASNTIFTSGFGYENLLAVYGADFDVDIIPMLGEYDPLPIITGYTENVVCDTTYVTLFDTVFYSTPSGWSFTFSDGTVINSVTDPMTINRVYTSPGPDTVTVATVNDCGRGDTTTWIIPYNFLTTPDAEFTKTQVNPICAGAPGVDFAANISGYADYNWDFGDGTTMSTGTASTVNHVYATPGLYYVELTVTEDGFAAADTFYLEDFESGWPAGYDRYDNDIFTPNVGVNPPFTGTNATAWLDIDADGDGDNEATSTSWNGPGEQADDWMLTTGIGPLPANQRLFWDAEALSAAFPDGYEVRISTVQLPANTTNYSTLLFSTTGENSFLTTRSVPLSGYSGQTVFIAFRNTSTDQFLLTIDNIRVGTATAGCSATLTKTDFVEIVDCTVIPPTAVLSADVTSGCAPLTVTFTDNTTVGDPATSWLWSFGDATFSTLQNPPPHLYTAAGTYFVSFEACNGGGCTTDFVTITVGNPPTISNIAAVDPSCAGPDGTITITATGGTPPLQYSIDNGVTFQAGNAFTGLGAASYNIVVEDALGCQSTSTVTLNPPATPSITNVASTDPLCNGDNGSIVITASGGTPPLQYSTDNGVTFQASNTFSVGAGSYNIVVEDAAGCQDNSTATLTDPPALNITNVSITDPTCNGGSDGQIVITASGGTGALQYSVNNGSTFQAGATFTGLGDGTYNILVEDANGCQASTTATLNEPPAVSITNVATTDPLCNGDSNGQIVITASGGTGALQYSIDNGGTFQAGATFTGLGAATYNIVVQDANGCQATTTATLNNPTAVSITNVATTDPLCNGVANGQLVITASGGTGALQYSVDNGGTFQAGNTFTGLGAATYNIVVQDANGCQASTTATLTDPTAVSITNVAVVEPLCNGVSDGSLTITASGGTGALQYSIDNGGTFQAGNNFTGLGASTYNIVVQDANGCQASTTATLTDPTAVSITNVATVDPTCNGGSDGTITITASGGTGALQYSIDNGGTFQGGNAFTALGAATYNIVVQDANGCQATTTATLTDPAAVTWSAVSTDENCGAGDGTLTLTGAGGDGGPYTYSIDNGGTFQASGSFTGLAAGALNVVVQDGSGCQGSGVETISSNGGATITGITEDISLTCNGDCNGQLTATTSGGTPPLVFVWVDGSSNPVGGNSATITGLCADTYTLTVTDLGGAGCPVVSSYTLNEPAAVTATIVVVDENCGQGNGSITITAAGGDGGPYVYSNDNGGTFQAGNAFTGLSANTYNIIVGDGSSCQSTVQPTVVANLPGATITNVAVVDPTCGLSNGSITITASGGTGALQYSIDNGLTFQGGNNFGGLGPATYNIVVEDAAGCQTTTTATLSDPGAPVINMLAVVDPSCGLTNGSITITASGGTPPMQYSIDNGGTFQGGNAFTGIGPATYNIVVQDGAGCQVTTTATLTDPGAPSIANVATTDPTCGNSDGQLVITAAGGAGPYQYSIDNGVTFQAGNTFTTLSAATYNIVVQDANGCQVSTTATLNNAGAPVITNVAVVDPTCGNNNGSITITASGGTPPLTYSIDNGVTFQAGNSFTGLATGVYDIVVEDGIGCQASTQVTLTDPGLPVIDSVVANDPTCGLTNGDFTVYASGGTPPYQYSSDNGGTFQANNAFTGLGAASYNIVVQDGAGCQVTTIITLTDPGSPVINIVNTTDPTCGNSDGQIDITASGGTGPLQYSIDNGVTFQAGNVFTSLAAATYDIVVQDANGCQVTTQVTLNSNGAPTITVVNVVDPSCGLNNGSIDIQATGGTPPLSYSIDNGGTFQATNLFTGLADATYDIVVEDANGCQAITQVTLVQPGSPSITNIAITDPTCGNANGGITITATGGVGPYQYSIDNGVTFQGSNIFTGMGGGSYDVVVEDANGCQVSSTISLNNVAGPTINSNNLIDPTCGAADGAITINASGGTPPLQYSIDGGGTFQAGAVFGSLVAGTYNIVVEDGSGCQATATVTLNNTGGLTIDSLVTIEPTCAGVSNGSIDMFVSGGNQPYGYSIDNGVTFQGNSSFIILGAGTYAVVIEDANGCQATGTVTLTEPAPVTLTVGPDQTICADASATLSATAAGGTGPYTYQWVCNQGTCFLDDATLSDPTATPPNTITYYAQAVDAAGCISSIDSVTVTVNQLPAADAGLDVSIIPGTSTMLNATPSGAASYAWTPTSTLDDPAVQSPLATPAETTTYTVTITDGNGCVGSDDVVVTVEGGELVIPTGFTPDNDGTNDFWLIENSQVFTNIRVEVYNRWGTLLYESDGYADPWDGTFEGNNLPTGSYYYVVDPGDGVTDPYTGSVTIIR